MPVSAASSRRTIGATGRPRRDAAEGGARPRQLETIFPRRGTIIFPHSALIAPETVTSREIVASLKAHGFLIAPLQLLSPEETCHGDHLFDIDLLAERIVEAVAGLKGAPVGLFGENLDAAAILAAAGRGECAAHALVLCNARPDLVPHAPAAIRAPTLCIVDEEENLALRLSRKLVDQLGGFARLAALPTGQNHRMAKSAATIGQLAAEWFAEHLPLGAPANA
jgi:hypothetical protein